MKRLIILLLIVGCLFAQEVDVSELSKYEKLMIYSTEKKSPAIGFACQLFVPTLGYLYVDNWKRGLKSKGIQFAIYIITEGIIVPVTGLNHSVDEIIGRAIGIGVLGTVWELVDVVKLTNTYNDELYKSIFGEYPKWKVSIIPQYQGATLTMSYSLD